MRRVGWAFLPVVHLSDRNVQPTIQFDQQLSELNAAAAYSVAHNGILPNGFHANSCRCQRQRGLIGRSVVAILSMALLFVEICVTDNAVRTGRLSL